MSECVLKTLACRGLRVGPSKFGTPDPFSMQQNEPFLPQNLYPREVRRFPMEPVLGTLEGPLVPISAY